MNNIWAKSTTHLSIQLTFYKLFAIDKDASGPDVSREIHGHAVSEIYKAKHKLFFTQKNVDCEKTSERFRPV